MKKQLQKFFAKKKNNKGFTLIELIIVIAILAILVGIVGMASIRYVEKSRKSADEQTLDSVSTAAQAVIIDPDNGLTVDATATITVATNGDILITGIKKAGTAPDMGPVKDLIEDQLAKKPALKSQYYQYGATLTITSVVTTGKITVDPNGWVKKTS